jgi:hypothetical protein
MDARFGMGVYDGLVLTSLGEQEKVPAFPRLPIQVRLSRTMDIFPENRVNCFSDPRERRHCEKQSQNGHAN